MLKIKVTFSLTFLAGALHTQVSDYDPLPHALAWGLTLFVTKREVHLHLLVSHSKCTPPIVETRIFSRVLDKHDCNSWFGLSKAEIQLHGRSKTENSTAYENVLVSQKQNVHDNPFFLSLRLRPCFQPWKLVFGVPVAQFGLHTELRLTEGSSVAAIVQLNVSYCSQVSLVFLNGSGVTRIIASSKCNQKNMECLKRNKSSSYCSHIYTGTGWTWRQNGNHGYKWTNGGGGVWSEESSPFPNHDHGWMGQLNPIQKKKNKKKNKNKNKKTKKTNVFAKDIGHKRSVPHIISSHRAKSSRSQSETGVDYSCFSTDLLQVFKFFLRVMNWRHIRANYCGYLLLCSNIVQRPIGTKQPQRTWREFCGQRMNKVCPTPSFLAASTSKHNANPFLTWRNCRWAANKVDETLPLRSEQRSTPKFQSARHTLVSTLCQQKTASAIFSPAGRKRKEHVHVFLMFCRH